MCGELRWPQAEASQRGAFSSACSAALQHTGVQHACKHAHRLGKRSPDGWQQVGSLLLTSLGQSQRRYAQPAALALTPAAPGCPERGTLRQGQAGGRTAGMRMLPSVAADNKSHRCLPSPLPGAAARAPCRSMACRKGSPSSSNTTVRRRHMGGPYTSSVAGTHSGCLRQVGSAAAQGRIARPAGRLVRGETGCMLPPSVCFAPPTVAFSPQAGQHVYLAHCAHGGAEARVGSSRETWQAGSAPLAASTYPSMLAASTCPSMVRPPSLPPACRPPTCAEACQHRARRQVHHGGGALEEGQAGAGQAGGGRKGVVRLLVIRPQPAAGGVRHKREPGDGSGRAHRGEQTVEQQQTAQATLDVRTCGSGAAAETRPASRRALHAPLSHASPTPT